MKAYNYINSLQKIANKYGYELHGNEYCISVSKKLEENQDYDFYDTNIDVIYSFDEDSNKEIQRFAISFSGYGSKDRHTENKIYNGIIKAKKMVDELNDFLDNTIYLNIGERVEVTDIGCTYSSYDTWEGLKGYEDHFVKRDHPIEDRPYTLLNIDIHNETSSWLKLALISDTETNQVYIVEINGIRRYVE